MRSAYAPSKSENQDRPKSWRDCLAIHPACNLFELISAEELRDLIANVAKHGLRDKIDTYFKDGKCVLVDGRNRLDALASLGNKILDDNGVPLKDICNVRQFHDDAEVINFIISKNVIRRHLTLNSEAQRSRQTTQDLSRKKQSAYSVGRKGRRQDRCRCSYRT